MQKVGWTQNCVDCGAEYEAFRRNSKRCGVCRAYTDLMYVKDQTKDCFLCERVFAPTHSRDAYCGEHAIKIAGFGVGLCGYCKEEKPRAWKGVNVCQDCARAPQLRRGLLRNLNKKVQAQTDAAAVVPEAATLG